MKHGDGGKLDQRRPGKGFGEGFDRIWGSRERAKYIPPPLPDCANVAGVPAEEDKEDDDE